MKPVVTFTGDAFFIKEYAATERYQEKYKEYIDEEGYLTVASVYAINHPVLGQTYVYTSVVVVVNDDGSFETLNTLYKPA